MHAYKYFLTEKAFSNFEKISLVSYPVRNQSMLYFISGNHKRMNLALYKH